MKNYIFLLVWCFTTVLTAQTIIPDEIIGSYLAKYEEKGAMQQTQERKITLAEKGGQLLLSVVLCDACYPATFTHNEKLSEGFGKPVFINNLGIYMLVYNEKGFAVVIPSSEGNNSFSFVNLYTRSKKDYTEITTAKIEVYALKLLDYL